MRALAPTLVPVLAGAADARGPPTIDSSATAM